MSLVRVGDLAEADEGVAEVRGGLLAQVRGPLGLDLGLGLPGDLDRGPAALGDLHQPGPGVAGIGDPADVAGPLELVDLLDGLGEREWETPSLCAGWRVRDVAAHLTLSQMRPLPAVVAALRARGNFNRMVHDTAVRQARQLPVKEYAPRLRAMAGSHRKGPGVSHLEPLIDVLVHGQDIAIPLGRFRPMPTGAAAAAADRVQPGTWAALVGMRGWDPGEYTERTVGSLLAELVSTGRRFEGGRAVRTTR